MGFRAWQPFPRQPEWWDPVSGEIRELKYFGASTDKSYTQVTLELPPYGSGFVVFSHPIKASNALENAASVNFPAPQPVQTLAGAWTVRFDPKWGGPAAAEFPELIDWTRRPEPGVRFYAGTATYQKAFDLPGWGASKGKRVFLDLGELHELADIRLNGKSLGNVWTKPFRVEITDAVRAAGNRLEIEVTNFWANRVIGDAALPEAQRLTRTNIRRLTKETPLSPAGLLGPVQVLVEE